jgi:NAD(P)-dependent dehydrogenase (short-subunit alcohol dehydrogenase family)
MLLENKVAVVYGAGGEIGSAVARALADEGARVFVTGRTRGPVDAVVQSISDAGGTAEAATVDALDEEDVENHLRYMIDRTGRVDVSFNAVGLPPTAMASLVELRTDEFTSVLTAYATSYFLTARLAARHMIARRSGVILTLTAIPARSGGAGLGAYGPAQAAKDALMRLLSVELAPHGVRVANIRPHAIPDSSTIRRIYDLRAKTAGMTWEQYESALASRTHTGRLSTVTEVADAAVFLASDRATGLTGTTLNLTMGNLDD